MNSLKKSRKRHPSVRTTKNRITVNRNLSTRIVQILLTFDMTIVGTETNTMTVGIKKTMNKISPQTISLVRMKLMPDYVINVRIKNSKILIPHAHTNQFQASSIRFHNQQARSSHSVHWVEDQNQQTEYYDQINHQCYHRILSFKLFRN